MIGGLYIQGRRARPIGYRLSQSCRERERELGYGNIIRSDLTVTLQVSVSQIHPRNYLNYDNTPCNFIKGFSVLYGFGWFGF